MDHITALRVFVRVAEEGSFSRAARGLGMSKSAVSKYVAALEDKLGTRLLHRTTRQVTPTEEGRAYWARVNRILEELEEADNAVGRMQAEPIGTLRVSSALSFGLRHVAPAIPDFVARHPRLVVDLDLNDRMVDLLDEGIDVAIRIGELPDSSLVARRLAATRLMLVAAPSYLGRSGTPQTPADLAQHVCLLYRGRSGTRQWALGHGKAQQSVRVNGPLISNNGETLKAAAIAGIGIARLPSFLLDDALDEGSLVEVLPAYRPGPLPIHAVYVPSRHLSAKVRRFVDFLGERFAADGPRGAG